MFDHVWLVKRVTLAHGQNVFDTCRAHVRVRNVPDTDTEACAQCSCFIAHYYCAASSTRKTSNGLAHDGGDRDAAQQLEGPQGPLKLLETIGNGVNYSMENYNYMLYIRTFTFYFFLKICVSPKWLGATVATGGQRHQEPSIKLAILTQMV